MNGERVTRRATVLGEGGAAALVGPPWRIVGAGEVDVAGEGDILWRNASTSALQFWYMDGAKIKGRNGVVDEQGNVIRVGAPWQIAGVSGVAGDAAILWHNSVSNDLQFWYMDGAKIKGRNGVLDEQGNVIRVGTPWQIAG
jgi:hypothetical protein